MDLPRKTFCPLGKVCREIKDNTIVECLWLTKVAGMNPQTGENEDREECAITLMPLLSIQQARETHGSAAAIESLRNHVAEQSSQQAPLAAIGRLLAGRIDNPKPSLREPPLEIQQENKPC